MIDLTTPRNVTRWSNGEATRTTAVPTPFGPDHAESLMKKAVNSSTTKFGASVHDIMNDGEIAYVMAVWDTMGGDTSWASAFNRIRHGEIES